MLNFKNTKKLLLMLLITPSVLLLILSSHSIMNKPDIKKINPINLKDIDMLNSFNEDSQVYADAPANEDFNYKLIGIRAGVADSSVIVKKGNKEYVVPLGEKLEEIYELIEVSFKSNQTVSKTGDAMWDLNNKQHTAYIQRLLNHYNKMLNKDELYYQKVISDYQSLYDS